MNKKKLIRLYLLLILLNGCATVSLYSIASGNKVNLSKLKCGMNKAKVSEIMGNKTRYSCLWDFYVSIPNPYKTEVVTFKEKSYEVLYYFTEIGGRTRWERPILENQNLTPLIFYKNRLVCSGQDCLRNYLRYLDQ